MKKERFINILISVLCIGTLKLYGVVGSSPPPSGTIRPNMKTTEEIEPRTLIDTLPFSLNQSGSYYLASNLVGTVGTSGIIIGASDLTLDLNGYTMLGVNGSLPGITGIWF
ncbi:MAG: hypothetical protein GKR87_03215 [Kiritimatiellae bacterium]|nr:hypothetical protein [Kiritimatiellia bacterium]